jgi:tetratricopeptide (TPR) repeat protein
MGLSLRGTITMFNITAHSALLRLCATLMLLLSAQFALAAATLSDIQARWDTTNFTLSGKPQTESFEQLQVDVEAYTNANPGDAEGWVWRGIIDSSFAGAKGGLGALGLAKSARKHFDKAIGIDGSVMNGSAYTSLGTLYYSVPGWPLGFGDDKKAEEMLQKGLSLNPEGIDSNYFYGEYLLQKDKPEQARAHYEKALNAPARSGREVADAGRRIQAQEAIANIAG